MSLATAWSNYKTRGTTRRHPHHCSFRVPGISFVPSFATEIPLLALEQAEWSATPRSRSSCSSCCPASSSSSSSPSSPPSPRQVSLLCPYPPARPTAMAFASSLADSFLGCSFCSCDCRKPAPREPAAVPVGSEAHFFSGTVLLRLFSSAFLPPAAAVFLLGFTELLAKIQRLMN